MFNSFAFITHISHYTYLCVSNRISHYAYSKVQAELLTTNSACSHKGPVAPSCTVSHWRAGITTFSSIIIIV